MDQVGHGPFEADIPGKRAVEPDRLDREALSLGGYDGRIVHQSGHWSGVKRRGHGQKDQVVTKRGADFESKRETEIGVERALVEFVEDHRADIVERWIGLDHAGQDALGDDLDPGGFRGLGLPPDSIADRLPNVFVQGLGHAGGSGAGGKAAGFQHHDLLRGQAGVQHGERHACGLARAGRRLQHGAARLAERVDQTGKSVVYGKPVHAPAIAQPTPDASPACDKRRLVALDTLFGRGQGRRR